MEIGITKMSSKGQIVIPKEMRKNIKEGEKLILIQRKDQLIVKKANTFDKKLAEDLAFAKKTEEALKRIEKGKGITMSHSEFLKELESW